MHTRHTLKIIGLSLLMAIGLMAVGASAAQAKWQILLNGNSVSSIKLNANIPDAELLVPGLGIAIYCSDGIASLQGLLTSEDKEFTVSKTTKLTGCTDLGFGEVCDVSSQGQAVGTIVVTGLGLAGMAAGDEEYFIDFSISSDIIFNLPDCPLTDIDGKVSGKVRVDLLSALGDTNLKPAHFLDKGIFFGSEPGSLHDGNKKSILLSIEHPEGKTWALHLVGL